MMARVEKASDQIDLMETLLEIWRRKLTVAACAVAALLLAVIYLHVATPLYTASMTVVPAQNLSGSNPLGSSLGGLASLAGVSIGKQGGRSPFDDYMMSVNMPEVAAAMLARKDIAPIAFSDGWDERTASWHDPGSLVRKVYNGVLWMATGKAKPWTPPDVPAMQRYIKTKVIVTSDRDTGAATISFDAKSPVLAEHFLNVLNQILDGMIRRKARHETAEYISYISEQLQTTVTVSEQHQALAQLLSDQEKKAILAGSGLPYAADVFSAPYAPRTPSKPVTLIVLLASIVFGAFFGALYVLLSNRLRFMRFGAPSVGSRLASAE